MSKIEVEWVECSERLPLDGDGSVDVIVESQSGEVFAVFFCRQGEKWRFEDGYGIECYASDENPDYIRRWMAMPPGIEQSHAAR